MPSTCVITYGLVIDQHDQRADAHHCVAQAHAQADEPTTVCTSVVSVVRRRQHLAGLRGFEEFRALLDDVGVDGVAQVGGDALAQPADHVEARRREHAQRRADGKQRQEVVAQRHHALARVGCRPGPGRSATSARAERPACSSPPAPGTARPARCGPGRAAGRAAGRTASAATWPRRGNRLWTWAGVYAARCVSRPAWAATGENHSAHRFGLDAAQSSCGRIPDMCPHHRCRCLTLPPNLAGCAACTALALRLGFVPSLAGLSALAGAGRAGFDLWRTAADRASAAAAGAMGWQVAQRCWPSPLLAAWLLRLVFQLGAARQRHSGQRHAGRTDWRAQPSPLHASGRARMGALPPLHRRRCAAADRCRPVQDADEQPRRLAVATHGCAT